jgi:hypothetical protein
VKKAGQIVLSFFADPQFFMKVNLTGKVSAKGLRTDYRRRKKKNGVESRLLGLDSIHQI